MIAKSLFHTKNLALGHIYRALHAGEPIKLDAYWVDQSTDTNHPSVYFALKSRFLVALSAFYPSGSA